GVDGAYGSGSHFTGILGIFGASGLDPQTLFNIIAEGVLGPTGEMTGYMEDELSDDDIWDLVRFIVLGLIDDNDFIDFDTKAVIDPDLDNGMTLFGSVCAFCHGLDGQAIEFDGAGIRELADDNPWETMHKIRFGHPGTAMPSSIDMGWTNEDVRDVLGYAQTLPFFGM
ncbi:MAG: cytochrome c, partial [Thermodesulfobacteriota bacterium]